MTHVDVAIIGAGISGIDAAYHLGKLRPGTKFAVLESKSDIGGTWHTHRFPGIRSDSDLFTFGFSWKPWTGVPIATAPEILSYLNEAIDEIGIRNQIRFDHSVEAADWSSETQRWTLTLRVKGETQTLTCGFLWMCAGYFDHAQGFTPQWPGMDEFEGVLVHAQGWPDGLDYAGKNVVVIGSGATAATIVPAMAQDAAKVTMLQRSPTYYYPRPSVDEFTKTLRALDLPDDWYHEIMRRKFLHDSETTAYRARTEPDALGKELIGAAKSYLGADYDIATHFTPHYRAWHQRIALVPDGDLFVAIKSGRADVVTDQIDGFTAGGIKLASGGMLDADIVVAATGLNLTMFGQIALNVDGVDVNPADCVTHRAVMFTKLPNFATVFGYLRSSWTLRADLVSHYVCRILSHMEAQNAGSVTPQLRPQDADMPLQAWIDPDNFNPGYVMRALDTLPRMGDRQPWLMTQDYYRDREDLPGADLEDGTLDFAPRVQT